jgi:hypothetical protein
MRLAAGSADGAAEDVVIAVVADSMADSDVVVAEEAVLSAPSLEQAAPKMATAAIPATAAVFRRVVIIS